MSIGALNATFFIGMHQNALPIHNFYFLLYATQEIMHEKRGHKLKRIREAPKTIVFFQKWTPWTGKDKPTSTYIPKCKPLGSHTVG